MKRIISSLFAIAGIGFAAIASPLTPDAALQRARKSGAKKAAYTNAGQMTLSHTFSTETGSPTIYVFDNTAQPGYILLSADDVATPVLGYSDNGSFDLKEMSPQMKWWLEQYAAQIEYAVKHRTASAVIPTRANAAIAPMIKTKWNQSAPYNELCPTDPSTNKRCVTGCVATAMAQVMAYWKYPAVGKGTVNYRPRGFSTNLTMDFTQTRFDWANMLDEYSAGKYNATQANAVATLMKACGYSSKMNYSSSASGATSYNMGNALINNFNYNRNISYEQRNYYSTSEWNRMVYDELAAGRPVLYGGQSEGGGHQFVCDGYNDGFYHINWGWGGMSDGYFKLESLNPDSEGIGGGAGGYNFMQDIIKGVQPTATDNASAGELVQNGSLTATTSGSRVSLSLTGGTDPGWWNLGYNALNIKMSMVISPADNPSALNYAQILNQNVSSHSGFRNLSFTFPSTLGNGKYLCQIMTFDNSVSNASWRPMRCSPGMRNFIYITKSGSSLTVETVPPASLTLSSGNVTGEVYYQCVVKVSATLKNESEAELSATLLPVLVNQNGNIIMQGGSVAVTLMPGENLTKDWETVFDLVEGASAPTGNTQAYLMFANQSTGDFYDVQVPVTIKVNSYVSPSVLNFAITGATRETVNGLYNVWVVKDPAHIATTFSIRNSAGYFGYPTYVYVIPYGGNSILKMTLVSNSAVASGKIIPMKCETSFSAAVEGEVYNIGVMYYGPYDGNTGYMLLSQSAFTVRPETSGVDELEGERFSLSFDKAEGVVIANGDVAEMMVVDLGGNAVSGEMVTSTEGKRFTLDESFRGVAVVKAVSASGDVRTLKIVR